MIVVTVNGKRRSLERPTPVGVLVEEEVGREPVAIAVGINREVVPRAAWDDVRVTDGDEIEIISPFAGG